MREMVSVLADLITKVTLQGIQLDDREGEIRGLRSRLETVEEEMRQLRVSFLETGRPMGGSPWGV